MRHVFEIVRFDKEEKYIKDFMDCTSSRLGPLMMASRKNAFDAGMVYERIDFKSWIKHIRNEVKL